MTATIAGLKHFSACLLAGLSKAKNKIRYLEAEIRELKAQIHVLTNRDPHTKWIMCGRKKSFLTRAAAQRTAEKFGTGRVYECPVCFCFHITSQPPHEEKVLDRLNNPLGKGVDEQKISSHHSD